MSWLDREIERTCDRVFREAIAPGGWLNKQIRLHARWMMWGFTGNLGLKDRERFTASVAARIHDRAWRRVSLFGVPLWRVRYPLEWCAAKAEQIVTEWLADERIKFGDSRFHWDDGAEIADSEMSYWEAA